MSTPSNHPSVKVGSLDEPGLTAGSAHWTGGNGGWLWRMLIFNENQVHVATVYGDTSKEAEANAAQVLSLSQPIFGRGRLLDVIDRAETAALRDKVATLRRLVIKGEHRVLTVESGLVKSEGRVAAERSRSVELSNELIDTQRKLHTVANALMNIAAVQGVVYVGSQRFEEWAREVARIALTQAGMTQ